MTGYYLEYHIVASVILPVHCLTCLRVTTLQGLIQNNYMTKILLTQKTYTRNNLVIQPDVWLLYLTHKLYNHKLHPFITFVIHLNSNFGFL
jgi:hypothetical protein